MRHSPTNEKSAIAEVKVVDVEKRRTKDSSGKNYVRMFSRAILACFSCSSTVIPSLVVSVTWKLISGREIGRCFMFFLVSFKEYALKVRWADDSQYNIFRRYSMFFDLQVGWRNSNG